MVKTAIKKKGQRPAAAGAGLVYGTESIGDRPFSSGKGCDQ